MHLRLWCEEAVSKRREDRAKPPRLRDERGYNNIVLVSKTVIPASCAILQMIEIDIRLTLAECTFKESHMIFEGCVVLLQELQVTARVSTLGRWILTNANYGSISNVA